MPRLTIIVPSPGAPVEFEDTLASILQHRPDDCQVVVARREPYEDPYELSEEVAFPVYEDAATWQELLDAAVHDADSAVIGVVTCGIEVGESWESEPLALFADDPQTVAVAPVWQRTVGKRPRFEFGIRFSRAGSVKRIVGRRLPRRPLSLTAPSFAAGFYRREAWLRVGGPSRLVPETIAPLELGLKFQFIGGRVLMAPESRVKGDPLVSGHESGLRRGRAIEWLRRAPLAERRPSWLRRQIARLATAGREPSWSGRFGHLCGTMLGMLDRGYLRRWEEWSDQVTPTEPAIVPLDGAPDGDAGGEVSMARAA